jgi:probable HAF family extracellular repeat protein
LGTITFLSGINDAGDIVGTYSDSKGVDHGFLYSGGVYSDIDLTLLALEPGLHLSSSAASGINNAGQIVGEYTAVTPLPAALPLFATGLVGLGLLGWRRKRKDIAA